ncbi:uncharacterized protein [Physcomitrium patens]|uniref:Uncharacterized protein n=1 Tax=Physcomitrium patens TaxID=3218 RepID=A0A2K1KNG7_PHYPA|nr:uncharacterized protein LOC112281900 [Physcomitrium patens]PNR55307.1 hypothetical protein PHYPA_006203 [Physcomitrium patens]|eukprot:XP_024374684.1 uncharacterized protein LOC112281900 [Physcomitrella patens]
MLVMVPSMYCFVGNVRLWERGEKERREMLKDRGAMERRTGWLSPMEEMSYFWVVVVMIVLALRSGVGAEVVGQYANQTFPAVASGNLSSYDQTIQLAAFSTFARMSPLTGIPFSTVLPGDLANVTVEAVRLRVGSLRRYGVTLGRFTIPPGLRISNVSSLRVILVYRDFGNVSVYSSSVPGQVFVSSLVGIRVYNADLLGPTTPLPALTAVSETPMQVIIPPNARPSYCVEFDADGTALATNASATNVSATNGTSLTYACFSRNLGENYFALVGLAPPRKKSNTWKIILGTVLGVLGVIVLSSLLIFCCRRQLQKRKISKMQVQAEKGETLQSTVVRNSRAPVATQTRTRPMLEKDFNVT